MGKNKNFAYNFTYFIIASVSILFALNNLFGLNNIYNRIINIDRDINNLNREIIELKKQVDSLESQTQNSFNQSDDTQKANERQESVELSLLEQQIYQQINEYRVKNNLNPLLLDPRLSQIAKEKSKLMAKNSSIYGANDLETRGKEIEIFLPYKEINEIVGYTYGYANPTQTIINYWVDSPNGIAIRKENHKITGVGVAVNLKGEYYFTQIFVAPQELF